MFCKISLEVEQLHFCSEATLSLKTVDLLMSQERERIILRGDTIFRKKNQGKNPGFAKTHCFVVWAVFQIFVVLLFNSWEMSL